MKNEELIDDIIKMTPLKIRLRVSCMINLISAITELGYREEKEWSDEDKHILRKIQSIAEQQAERIIEIMNEWESAGKPDKI